MGSITGPTVKRTIDWDKVTTVEDIKAILIGMDLQVQDIPADPHHQLAGARYLFHPLQEEPSGTD